MSRAYLPAGYKSKVDHLDVSEGHKHLLSAGYIRPSLSGVYTILPLGQRVLDKIERSLDDILSSQLDASKVSLPTLATRTLWETTGRWKSAGDELFRLKDRKTTELCLSPTNEESVTKMVAGDLNSYRHMPIRLYQVSRKFRDEMRPRGGLLRGREFLMKDLYTFDAGEEAAHATYEEVKTAYTSFFDSLGVAYHIAEADSGGIGGDKSHEFHLPSTTGADTLLKCSSCEYVANQELANTKVDAIFEAKTGVPAVYGHQEFPDTVLFETEVPKGREINSILLLRQAKQLDSSVTSLQQIGFRIDPGKNNIGKTLHKIDRSKVLKVEPGDACPECESGTLQGLQAIEIGHTFHLGQKYSQPIGCKYTDEQGKLQFVEMGCHGIGLTRLLAALAETSSDKHGLRWPAGLAPYASVLIVPPEMKSFGDRVAKRQHIEAIDDRTNRTMAYRVRDMQLKGVPRVYVIGKEFLKRNNLDEDLNLDECTDEMIDELIVEHAKVRGSQPRDWEKIQIKDMKATG